MSIVTRWKVVSFVLVLVCGALAYRVLDQGITRTYLDASIESSDRHIELLTSLIEEDWRGMAQEQVLRHLEAVAQKRPPGSTVLKHDQETGAILFEGVRFEFVDGKLAHVN
ncbi:Imm58 family immunity protein [Ralstonia pseudosolanacearum]|uniref:Imm58 family immunity protein n=1 Tax=Ralstonia pseudosolanacearum TaxID=1310165 RepID=UPI000A5C3153|nr:Imm58 family immunity protein [Ralstonia pseudosolanacearum]MCL1621528.1 Imm58 family immunity protein [Ralstonia pseudosolanacearum CaRs-Mep]